MILKNTAIASERVCVMKAAMIIKIPAFAQDIAITIQLRVRVAIIIDGAVNTSGNPSKIKADGWVILVKEEKKSASGRLKSIAAAIIVADNDVKLMTAEIFFNVFGNNAPKHSPVNRERQTRRSAAAYGKNSF